MDSDADVTVHPRVARTKARVLASVRELLASRGLTGVTVDGVAKQAGVSRTTIYRHWSGIPELLRDAAQGVADDAPLTPQGGGLRDDLIAIFRQLASRIGGRAKGAELAALLAAAERDPEVRTSYRTLVLGQRRQVQILLAAAVTFGELPPGADLEVAVDLLAGPVFYRRLVMGASPDRSGYVESVIDIVLAGLGHRDSRPGSDPA